MQNGVVAMLPEREQLEYTALKIIAASFTPVGSGFLSREMAKSGEGISEATAGRILNRFDLHGLTTKIGFQGRILTTEGGDKLKDLEGKAARNQQGADFFNILNSHSKERLIDILIARKAIERELARLAAIHATQEEIREMWAIQKFQFETFTQDLDAAEQDVQFHRLIAIASRNPVLRSAIEMIRQDGQLSPILEYIRKKVHSIIAHDHAQIIMAIEKRQPELAEAKMVRHLESIIHDVNKYWDQIDTYN
jgi:GntR family L-lactate dehydrogenase operon transcriptional regulator